jgi:hypothetical protein
LYNRGNDAKEKIKKRRPQNTLHHHHQDEK